MEIEILRVVKLPSGEQGRVGQTDTVVFYRVDGRHNDSTIIRKDTSDEKEILAAIKSDQEAKGKLVGKKLTI